MFFTKPFILPLIAYYFWLSYNRSDTTLLQLMVGAFAFSCIGSISLMLTPETPTDTSVLGIPKNKYFFLLGLGSFLIAQLLFIASYLRCTWNVSFKAMRVWFSPFLVYWLLMMGMILPPLSKNPEKRMAVVPVIIYSAILILMAAASIARYGRTNPKSFRLTVVGSCLFVVSDSLIAINFLAAARPMAQAGFVIMLTYVAAEFLIALGIIEHFKADAKPSEAHR